MPKATLYRDLDRLDASHAGAVIAIGNFDGVHLGHQAVIRQARAMADEMNAPLGILLFDPHPRQYFKPDDDPFRLTKINRRASLLGRYGADFVLALAFDEAMSQCTSDKFINDILIGKLNIRGVVVGHDFHYGKGRQGTPDTLLQAGKGLGFQVNIIEAITDPSFQDHPPISSSRVRKFLREGDCEQANTLLGHVWSIEGEVQQGDQRGRTIGFPTANIELDDYIRPAFGVYAVHARIDDGSETGLYVAGVANLGMRPTVGTPAPRLEVHLFDYDGDLYGKELSVGFHKFLRPEIKFEDFDALKKQISLDSDSARDLMADIDFAGPKSINRKPSEL
jgi:riboflavin kinase/FMN adenylyltransferase